MKNSLLILLILFASLGYAQTKLYKDTSVIITATEMRYGGSTIPFVIDTTGKPNYTDFTSLENWADYGAYVEDWKFVRNILIVDYMGGWDTLIPTERKPLIRYNVWPNGTDTIQLDSSYTSSKRDNFEIASMKRIDMTDCIVRKSVTDNSKRYFDIQIDDAGVETAVEITTYQKLTNQIDTLPSCRVFTTAGQSITDSAWNTVDWASESYDTQTMHDNVTDNSRITIPVDGDGKYLITASLSFGANGTGNRGIRIQKNGTGQERRVMNQNAGAIDFVSSKVSDVLDLVAGDYLEIAAWQSSTAALVLLTGADRNHFTLTKLH